MLVVADGGDRDEEWERERGQPVFCWSTHLLLVNRSMLRTLGETLFGC
jgi:hypothetical protein